MISSSIAVTLAIFVLAFEEALRRFYPSRPAWVRLRSRNGRRAVRAMRLRMEATSRGRVPPVIAQLLVALAVAWIALRQALDKSWLEVALEVTPYVLLAVAVARTPGTLRVMAERMRDHERSAGEDPEVPYEDEGGDGGEIAL